MISSSVKQINKHGGALVNVTPLLRIKYRSMATGEKEEEEEEAGYSSSSSSLSSSSEEEAQGAAPLALVPLVSFLHVKLGRVQIRVNQPLMVTLYQVLLNV